MLKIIAYLNDPSPPNPRIPDADRTAKSFALLGLGMASRPASGIVPQTGLILSTLITFADNPDRLLREMAVQMLGFVDNPIALPTLIRILEDRELSGGIEMREYAIGALAQIGDLTTLPILSVLFAESNKVIRIEAAAAVLQIIDGKKSSSVALIGGSQSMAVISFTSFPSISKMRLSMRRALPK
ncbi:HEAT repeat domain-containing protein [Candidatus Acetothermia bacterium]|nr:HEAT repeat domain-containing protein [Candidatus Acetothermia bacterium]